MARIPQVKCSFGSASYAHVLSALALLIVCLSGCQEPDETFVSISKSRTPTKVNVLKPTFMEGVSRTVSYFGRLEPNRRQSLGFSIAGKLSSIPEKQTRFRDGAVVAEIDHENLKRQRDEIESRIASSSIERDRVVAQQKLAELNQSIQQHLIFAPFDCVVERVFVSRNSFVRPATPVVEVFETALPQIQIDLPRKVANEIFADKEYKFWLDGEVISGKLLQRSFSENPPGSVEVSFSITSSLSDVSFALGQSVKAEILLATSDSGYWLPLSSLQKNSNGLWTVFVIKPASGGTTLEKRIVKIVQLDDDRALVAGELADQYVVRDGVHRIVQGQKVEPILAADENESLVSSPE